MVNILRHLSSPIAVVLVLFSSSALSEVRINGFASFVGGLTTSEEESRNLINGAVSDTTFISDAPTLGTYNDKLSFRPDSIFGIQVFADLMDGLSVTGQITGAGGEDFDANIAWAYFTYEFNESFAVLMGRQRMPLFLYSDSLDVGYSYHWIRPPVDAVGVPVDDYEGIQLRYTSSTDNWDSSFQFYTGSSSAVSPTLGSFGLDNTAGLVAYTSNGWLQLRATYLLTDAYFNSPLITTGGMPQNQESAVETSFAGIAVHATFDELFVISEYVVIDFDDPLGGDDTLGDKHRDSYYVSAGYRVSAFTPHITFSVREVEQSEQSRLLIQTQDTKTETWTIGLRWDFHSNAVFKVEYLTKTDESDDFIKNNAGIGNTFAGGYTGGRGDAEEVDLFTFGVDIVF